MTRKYQIISDGSCDLPSSLAQEKHVVVVPFYVSFDSQTYQKEIEEVDIRTFYQEEVDHPKVFPKTSMPTVDDFEKTFVAAIEKGLDVQCICITSKFSGSVNSARLARENVLESHPEAQIEVIDAQVNTVLQGLYVLEAVKLQEAGKSLDEATQRLLEIRSTGRIFFTVGSLDYLQHGGRIGKVTGIVGSMLSIKPLITLRNGEIFSSGIARSRMASLKKVLALCQAYLKETGKSIENYSLCVGFGYDCDEAETFKKEVMEELQLKESSLCPLYQIGATIAVHTGPYPLGIAIIEKAL